jgi:hypothetical protein
MRLEFAYTLADIREAAMPALFAGNRRLYRHHWIGIIALSLLFTSFGTAMWVIQSKLGEPAPPQRLLLEILPSFLPATLVLCLIGESLWKTRRKLQPRAGAKERRPTTLINRSIGFLLVSGISLGFWMMTHGHAGWLWHPTPLQLVIARLSPWAVVLAAFSLASSLQARWRAAAKWLAQPGWDQPRTVELDDDGYCSSHPLARTRQAWACVAAARETQNLLILTGYDDSQLLIPKRAFACTEDFWHCRNLLRAVVPRTQFLAHKPIGFLALIHPSASVEAEVPRRNNDGQKDLN